MVARSLNTNIKMLWNDL